MPPIKSDSTTALPPWEVLTLSEAAAYLRTSEDALRQLATERAIPARKIGEEWRFLKTALQSWLSGPPDGGWHDLGPRWFELLSVRPLLAEIENRLLAKLATLEPPHRERDSKQRLLALAGAWKEDSSLDEMLQEIYRQRGRPMTEDKE